MNILDFTNICMWAQDSGWDENLRYNCEIGAHYVVANTFLHMVGNSYVITDQDENTTTICITGDKHE
jgi:hypothetical protein